MDCICNQGTDTEHCLKRICPWAEMGNRAQIFKTMPLFLKRIIRRRSPFHHHLVRLHFERLFGFRSSHDCPFHNDCRPYVQFADLFEIRQFVTIDNLQRLKKGAVIDYNKTKCLGIADTPDPSSNRYRLTRKFLPIPV